MDEVPKNPPQMIGDFLPSSFEGVNPTKAMTTMKSESLRCEQLGHCQS